MIQYPTDIVTGGGWARIHKGHGLDHAALTADLHQGMGDPLKGDVMVVQEVHFQYRPRIKWCDPACDSHGEWHGHWDEVRPSAGSAFTLVRWERRS